MLQKYLGSTHVLALALLFPALASGQLAISPSLPGGGLKGDYFANKELTGNPTLSRTDPGVNFQWSWGSPSPGIPIDRYSIRWSGQVEAPVTGAYTFYTRSDDGVRLWVDGKLLINHWTDHSPDTDQSVPVTLTAGRRYDVQLEFYENMGGAVIQLLWRYPNQGEQIIPPQRLYPVRIALQDPPPVVSREWLSDLNWLSATNGWGPPELDRSNGEQGARDGRTLTVAGRRYAYGVGVHSLSDLRYALDDRFDVFKAVIGVDDEVGDRGTVVFEVWLDGKRVYQSPTMRGNMPGVAIEIPVEDAREMRLVVTDAGDGNSYDHADWADARFEGVERVKYLSDLNWVSATNGSGPVEKDHANGGSNGGDGARIKIDGMTYRKGLGTRAVSEIKYRLDKQYELFSAVIGIDDSATSPGSAIFEVWSGANRLFRSNTLRRSNAGQHIALVVRNLDDLVLKVLDAGDGNTGDLGDWADAKLLPMGSDGTTLAAPTGLKATAGNAQISLTWNLVAGAAGYHIYRGTSEGGESTTPVGSTSNTSYLNSGLTNGTKYFYKVRAVRGSILSNYSNEASAIPGGTTPTVPPAPTGLTATPADGRILLTWQASSGATSYNVYRGTSAGGESATPIATNINATVYLDSGRTNGTRYFYTVRAVNAAGMSGNSNEASATPGTTTPSVPPAPTGLMATPGDARITLSWQPSAGATSYNVYRGTTAGGQSATPIATNVAATSFLDTGRTNGTRYYYKVRAVNAGGMSEPSNEASAVPGSPAPPPPTGLMATPGDARITLSWQPSAGAASYNVYRGTTAGGQSTTPIANVAAATYLDTGRTNGTRYYYKVRAVNAGGMSEPSNEASATPTPPAPGGPTGLIAAPGNARVTLNWTAVTGAGSYNIYRGTTANGQSTTPIATNITATTYNNTGLINGTTYFYKVAAVNGGGPGPMSNEASATPIAPPAAPTGLTATGGDAQVSLSWQAVTGAATYNVYRGTTAGGQSTTPIATNLNATAFVDAGRTNGTRYFYKVRAVNAGGTSEPSNEASATPAPPAPGGPTGLTAAPGNARVTLNWTAVTGAGSYNIYRGTASNGQSTSPIATNITATTYSNTGLTNGTTYFYKVAAVNGGGPGPMSNEASATPIAPPVAPTGLTATSGDAQVSLAWQAVTGATGYNVYRGTTANGQAAAPVATGLTTPGFVNPGLVNGTTYYFKVTALNASGEGPRSAEANATPFGQPPPADPALTAAFRLLRQATWGPRPGDVDRVRQIGATAFLNEQFAAAPSVYPDTLYTMSVEDVQEYFMRLALTGQDQLRQRAAWALHQIWVVSAVEINNTRAIVNYKRLLLNGAFGNYRDLMRDMTLNPAMGRYLNMLNNRSQAITNAPPNENYARELKQLFTIGLVRLNPNGTPMVDAQNVPIPSYTEADVRELARIFTGWTFGDGNPATVPNNSGSENYTVPMEAVERYHDTGQKTFLGNNFAPMATARQELDQALDILFNHPNIGPFVCRQLIQRLVTSNPSPAYIAAVAGVFNNNGSGVRGDLAAVFRAILTHPEASLGTPTSGKLMEPALFVISQARSLNAQVVDHPFMSDRSEEMGQRVLYPGSVFSYFSPNARIRGTTLFGPEYQILTTVTTLSRTNYTGRLISGGFGADVTIDFTPFTNLANDAAALTDFCNQFLMGGLMSTAQRTEIINAVQVTPATNPTERVRTALYLTLASAQYQVDR